jgi:cation diffusion facilitator family transporter
LTKLLIKLFIKNSEDLNAPGVRSKHITLGSSVGIFVNIVLFLIKFTIGLISGAVSITADAFNNLSDIGSSAVTAIGLKLSEKPADREHPFGHGRIEYMSGLVIAALILLVGVALFKSSVQKAFNPSPLKIDALTIILLSLSVLGKLWLYFFNKFIGKKVNSAPLMATAQDSINDCFATSAVLVSIIICLVFRINIDPYIGMAVALFIVYSAINTFKETLDPLLGMPPEKETIDDIEKTVLSYPDFLGIHDLIVHNYGPGRSFASLHVEVPAEIDIIDCHEKIDACEKRLFEELKMEVVIHMDPIVTSDGTTSKMRQTVSDAICEIYPNLSIHDFRMVDGNKRVNLIFDVVVPFSFKLNDKALKLSVNQICKKLDPRFETVITIDRDFC